MPLAQITPGKQLGPAPAVPAGNFTKVANQITAAAVPPMARPDIKAHHEGGPPPVSTHHEAPKKGHKVDQSA